MVVQVLEGVDFPCEWVAEVRQTKFNKRQKFKKARQDGCWEQENVGEKINLSPS